MGVIIRNILRFMAIMVFLIPFWLKGQSNEPKFHLQLLSGTEAGWWVYNKGSTDTLPQIHRGYDRTHFAFMLPIELGMVLTYPQLEWGLSFTFLTLYDDELISSAHSWRKYRIYPLTTDEHQVRLFQWGLSGSYIWIDRPRYEFQAGIKLGGFHLIEVLEVDSPFGLKWFQEILLTQKVRINRHFDLMLVPKVARMRIQVRNSPYAGERHDIYRIGFHLGLRMKLSRQ